MSNEFLSKRVAKFTWDFAVQGGANNSSIALGNLPDNAIILGGGAHVVTKPVDSDAGDDQTIALGYTGATTALWAATAISGLTAGTLICLLPGAFEIGAGQAITTVDTPAELAPKIASEWLLLSGNKEVLLTIGNDVALTAGKINLWIEYYVSE